MALTDFTVKDWHDYPTTDTPLSAAAIEDIETRVTDWAGGVTFRNYREYRPESYGAVGNGSTDDTTAFKSVMAAIQTSGIGGAIVLTAGKTYLLNGAPDHSKFGNAIVPLPLKGGILEPGPSHNYPFPPQCMDVQIRSLGKGSATIKTTRTGDTYSATYGAPSIIGGPTPEQSSPPTQASTGNLTVEGVTVQLPTNPEIAGLDFWYTAALKVDGLATCCPETSVGTRVDISSMTIPTHKWSFGIRLPNGFNQGTVILKDIYIQGGPYCGIVLSGAHAQIRASIQLVALAYGVATGVQAGITNLGFGIMSDCKYGFAGWDETNGAYSLTGSDDHTIIGGPLHFEAAAHANWNFTNFILDANSKIVSQISFARSNLVSGFDDVMPGTVTGGTKMNFTRVHHEYLHSAKGLRVTGPSVGGDNPYIRTSGAASSDTVFQAFLNETDANPTHGVLGSGMHTWGVGGATAYDTSLERSAANTLKLKNQLVVDAATGNYQGVKIVNPGGTATPFSIWKVDTDANASFSIVLPSAMLAWGAGGASAYDMSLIRSAAGTLKLGGTPNGNLVIDQAAANGTAILVDNASGGIDFPFLVKKATADTQPLFQMLCVGGAPPSLAWGVGGTTSTDTNLKRQAANQLQTDDTFIAVDGVATKTKAGTPVDADFQTTPPIGTIVVDTTANKIWARTASATWKGVVIS